MEQKEDKPKVEEEEKDQKQKLKETEVRLITMLDEYNEGKEKDTFTLVSEDKHIKLYKRIEPDGLILVKLNMICEDVPPEDVAYQFINVLT